MSTHRMCAITEAHLAHEFSDGTSLIALTYACPGVPHRPAGDVPPGPCWHDSGYPWNFDGSGPNTRCELLAGHAGAHLATRPNGGEAVWNDEDAAQGSNRRSVALGDAEILEGAQNGSGEFWQCCEHCWLNGEYICVWGHRFGRDMHDRKCIHCPDHDKRDDGGEGK